GAAARRCDVAQALRRAGPRRQLPRRGVARRLRPRGRRQPTAALDLGQPPGDDLDQLGDFFLRHAPLRTARWLFRKSSTMAFTSAGDSSGGAGRSAGFAAASTFSAGFAGAAGAPCATYSRISPARRLMLIRCSGPMLSDVLEPAHVPGPSVMA